MVHYYYYPPPTNHHVSCAISNLHLHTQQRPLWCYWCYHTHCLPPSQPHGHPSPENYFAFAYVCQLHCPLTLVLTPCPMSIQLLCKYGQLWPSALNVPICQGKFGRRRHILAGVHTCVAHTCVTHTYEAHMCVMHTYVTHMYVEHTCVAHTCAPHMCVALYVCVADIFCM